MKKICDGFNPDIYRDRDVNLIVKKLSMPVSTLLLIDGSGRSKIVPVI